MWAGLCNYFDTIHTVTFLNKDILIQMLKRVIKFKNGTEIICDDDELNIVGSRVWKNIDDFDEFDMGLSEDAWEIVKKVLMPKLNLKEHKIIILETPSMKQHGFFYDQCAKL